MEGSTQQDHARRDNFFVGGCLIIALCVLVVLAVLLGQRLFPTFTRVLQTLPQTEIPDRPQATRTPRQTAPPTPQMLVLTGDGDSFADVRKWIGGAIARITYDGQGQFTVWNHDAYFRRMQTLVRVKGPYRGNVPIDMAGGHTWYFEVQAVGPWRIELLRPEAAPPVLLPGTISGDGDDVISLSPRMNSVVLTVDASTSTGQFIVWAYGEESSIVINETAPYSGSVVVRNSPLRLAVRAAGPWRISIEYR